MLVLNCTKAAADFFTVTRQGKKQSPIEKPPTPAIGDTLYHDQPVSSWLIHAIKVQRKNVLIAMDVHTRYAMVFAGIKKGNWSEFANQWLERLFNNMQFRGEEFELCDEASFHSMLNEFARQHPRPHFCQRGDRSVQSHINDVAWHIENWAHETGHLPEHHEDAASFDEWLNSMTRSTKSYKNGFFPDEEMFLHWITRYGDLDSQEEPMIRQYFNQSRRMTIRSISDPEKIDEIQAMMEAVINEYNEGLASLPDNVIDIRQARANKQKG
ncbi:hypothetical protein VA7868_03528 [Vibrio aerogenes CECT 7868]|uniref:DUF6933 domain-containing protein n=1 Tax=Vibrio aerogenes CECT 7868 TaxID=1216006 RepID=A0A1M6AAS5_9VIBR|nr:hypothetical protein [Vibrio aerogenes]SHI33559.1 hypothetical protein VA7868_03528 [Vibrio aerogenes CECT 7868]